MLKYAFSMSLRGLLGFINSVFKLVQLTFQCSHNSYISK
ncbi:hypothetical protein [Candidatus Enterovibrio altilux]